MFVENVPYHLALIAGLSSFFTPCVLPLIPAYFTFISGFSLDELTDSPPSKIRLQVILSTLAFVLGFSVVFVLMGASATLLSGLLFEYKEIIVKVGGVLIIFFGVHLTGIFRFKKLEVEKRFHFQKKPLHAFGTFLVGMAFGAGWSPCVGPLLGSILALAAGQETVAQGILLLSLYALGLALPFMVMSVFIDFLLKFLKKAIKVIRYINIGTGVLLILVGVFLLTGQLFIFGTS